MKTMSSEILVWLSKFQLVERRMTHLLEIISMYKLQKRFLIKEKTLFHKNSTFGNF